MAGTVLPRGEPQPYPQVPGEDERELLTTGTQVINLQGVFWWPDGNLGSRLLLNSGHTVCDCEATHLRLLPSGSSHRSIYL